MYLRGQARRGPTLREAVLMHAVARLVLHPLIPNIQTSWVKMGPDGAAACLDGRRQRSRRHADEREHLARGRHAARPGVPAGGDGGADPLARPHAAAAGHAVPARCPGAPAASFNAARTRAGGADAVPAVSKPRRSSNVKVRLRMGGSPCASRTARSSGWSMSMPIPGRRSTVGSIPRAPRRGKMRQEAVVAEAQRHRLRRRASGRRSSRARRAPERW